DRRRKTLIRGGTYGRYLASGHLVYLNAGTLFAVPFDLDRLETRGTPVPVQDQVAHSMGFGSAQFDCSMTPSGPGTFIYQSGTGSGLVTLQRLDAAGNTQPILAKPGNFLAPELSPDGNRTALSNNGEIWVYDPRRDTMTPLTFSGGHTYPIWSPDGRFVLF